MKVKASLISRKTAIVAVSLCIVASVFVDFNVTTGRGRRRLQNNRTARRNRRLERSDSAKYPPDIFDENAPAVVHIVTSRMEKMQDTLTGEIFEDETNAEGSGFIWDSEGHLVTNFHVVQDAFHANVTILMPKTSPKEDSLFSFIDGFDDKYVANEPSDIIGGPVDYNRVVFSAKVVGVDPDRDTAVLKVDVDSAKLTPISVGQLAGNRIGEAVYAIGHPFGFDHSMSSGIISGLAREIRSPTGRPIQHVIQTDASINPGNSGGPLLNRFGELIGMNTEIASTSGSSAGIGFAVPVDDIKRSVETLIKDGKIERASIGIVPFDPMSAMQLGVVNGVLILQVDPESEAAKAGLLGTEINQLGYIAQLGDIIIKFDDTDIDTDRDLYLALQDKKAGDEVKLVVQRYMGIEGNKVQTKNVEVTTKLVEAPDYTPEIKEERY